MIIKQGWFSDIEILKIHQQINRETSQLDSNTVTKTLNTEKQKLSNWIETPSNRNRNTVHPNPTEEKLKQELKGNAEILKIFYIRKKDRIIIFQEPRLENSQVRNWKNKRLINTYLNEQHYGIRRTNLCKSKISLW